MIVSPGDAFGGRSDIWGDALSNITAGAVANLTVRARDVVGNAIWTGGSELAVYAFHQEIEVRCDAMPCRKLSPVCRGLFVPIAEDYPVKTHAVFAIFRWPPVVPSLFLVGGDGET